VRGRKKRKGGEGGRAQQIKRGLVERTSLFVTGVVSALKLLEQIPWGDAKRGEEDLVAAFLLLSGRDTPP